ncbi:universal stress protein [Echinococcus multilocularis]|uniref:Universal stress protein n=1 Tax=Echinococcus multilocularis TaxID=6211 RepID=A0A068YFW9_ECHMU|nr:universal stress protein [Echinococcus multilocularis]
MQSDKTDADGGGNGSSGSRSRVLLFPVQDGTASERVFRWYSQSFRRPGDELLILAVVEPTLRLRELQKGGVSSNDPLVEAAMMGGRSVVRRFLQWAHGLSLPCRGLVQLDISPGLRIVRTARERGVHAILMGPRVRAAGDFEGQEFDSVTEYVLRNCPNITLTVVPPSTDDRRMRRDSFYKQFIENFF